MGRWKRRGCGKELGFGAKGGDTRSQSTSSPPGGGKTPLLYNSALIASPSRHIRAAPFTERVLSSSRRVPQMPRLAAATVLAKACRVRTTTRQSARATTTYGFNHRVGAVTTRLVR